MFLPSFSEYRNGRRTSYRHRFLIPHRIRGTGKLGPGKLGTSKLGLLLK